MPELPEVETIRRGLLPTVVGRTIREIAVGDGKVLQCDAEGYITQLQGQELLGITRRGKSLIFELQRHQTVIHLGMTGQLTFRDPRLADSPRFLRHPATGLQRVRQHAPDRHTHVQFVFEDGSAMLFRDIRKFGKIFLFDKDSGELEKHFAHLGLEPFGDEFVLERFRPGLSNRSTAIKARLLDQGWIAGVGNIYADEALFEARIHPQRPAGTLKAAEVRRLFQAVPLVLEKGLRFGGTSMRDYVNSDGDQGMHQEELMVYGRPGESCRVCATTIEKIVVAQRGTHFCPSCQKPPRLRKKGKPRKAKGANS